MRTPVAKLPGLLFEPEEKHNQPPSSTEPGGVVSPSRALLRSPPPPKTPLGEFVVPHHPRRAKTHRERLVDALGVPRWSRGHGATSRCVASSSSPAGPTVSHPLLDQRPRLDPPEYPFVRLISDVDRQANGPGLMNPWTAPVNHCRPGSRLRGPIPWTFL
jgi:hypothetical protein